MTDRVPVRQLQQHASEIIARVSAGERVEITRNGRLVAVLSPPDPEQRVREDLIRTGAVDAENAEDAERAGGLAGWTPRTPSGKAGAGAAASLSEVLLRLREEEDR
ncbi:type II toxin-antitoxin system prevent-host-death family antitoxin [Streptomyces sp. DSM 44917]|uniref:Antitoxin n=1 Tax=Streptomyces boetiae TaxID=3075541 RepID=A0ABU2L818_9ACTN|nr:type II toxin-antitoxin system prevent-host-death family antitoxin [Streptomyces sp. DSM 44917]MDT0307358.1 type II toxin-antitoxin system prevent-host-death family antitoxin [Streptomyces sp. DSM 44917]